MDRWANTVAGDRVYQTIKSAVITRAFPGGQRIYLEPLAAALGVSTTPVREALNRLAAEDLVIKAPRKGFIARTLSEGNLRGYYEFTRSLLTRELESLDATARSRLPQFEPMAVVLHKLNRRALSDVNTLARYTGEVFLNIAASGGNEQVTDSIGRANDHLFYIRTLEPRYLKDVQGELKRFCELLLADRCEDLVRELYAYHDRRARFLPALIELAKQ